MQSRLRSAVPAALVFLLSFGPPTLGASPEDEWLTVAALVRASEPNAALKRLKPLLAAARKAKDERMTARALAQIAALNAAIYDQHDRGLEALRSQPPPKDPTLAAILAVVYAEATRQALERAWTREAGEPTAAGPTRAIDSWSRAEYGRAAELTLGAAWKARDALGDAKVSDYADLVDPNDFPEGVRATVRDALTRAAATHLGNTTHWGVMRESEAAGRAVAELLETNPKAYAPDDFVTHPLDRIAALYADLEAWHKAQGRNGAALAARIDRLDALFDGLRRADARDALISAWEAALAGQEEEAWWAFGTARLAARLFEHREDRVAARALATAAAAKHPGSIGGRAARALIAEHELPVLNMRAVRVDGPRRASITVTVANAPEIHFRAYAGTVVKGKPAFAWSQPIETVGDFEAHEVEVVTPFTKRGTYTVVASLRPSFAKVGNLLRTVTLDIASFAYSVGLEPDAAAVNVYEGKSGVPIRGAAVEIRSKTANGRLSRILGSAATDATGGARVLRKRKSETSQSAIVIRSGKERVVVDDDIFFMNVFELTEASEQGALIYVDRPVYRPGQTLHFKALAYRHGRKAGDFAADSGRKLTVKLLDARYQLVTKKTLKANAFGSVAGSFVLPEGRLLGRWALQIEGDDGSNAGVQVEEYKRPTFEAKVLPLREPARLGVPALVEGEVRYLFGAPAAGARVRWTVALKGRVAPAAADDGEVHASADLGTGVAVTDATGRFSFEFTPKAPVGAEKDPRLADAVWEFGLELEALDRGGETHAISNSLRAAAASLMTRLAFADGFAAAGRPIELAAWRGDLDGAPRAGAATWTVHRLAQPQAPSSSRGLSPKTMSKPRQRTNSGRLELILPEVAYSAQRELAEWSLGDEVARGEALHDQAGSATISVPGLTPGAYRVTLRTTDPTDKEAKSRLNFVAAGDAPLPLAVPVFLAIAKPKHASGDTATILAHSGFGGPLFLDAYRSGARVWRRALEPGAHGILRLPIRSEDRGGLVLQLTVVRDHQVYVASQDLAVPWVDRILDISLERFRDHTEPGAQEILKVNVRGRDRQKVAAELLAYMYDKSLDRIAKHAPPTPLSLYPLTMNAPSTINSSEHVEGTTHFDSINLRLKETWPDLHGDQMKWAFIAEKANFPAGVNLKSLGLGLTLRLGEPVVSGGMTATETPSGALGLGALGDAVGSFGSGSGGLSFGGGGPSPAKPAMDLKLAGPQSPPGSAPPARQDFRESAFFAPQVATDAAGVATIAFTAPETLSAWNLWIHAVTKDLRAGALLRQIRTAKDLAARLVVPRFVRDGDEAELTVLVENARAEVADAVIEIVVRDEAGAELAKKTEKLRIGAAGSVALALRVKAPLGPREMVVEAKVSAGKLADGEKRRLPILSARQIVAESRAAFLKAEKGVQNRSESVSVPDAADMSLERVVVRVDADPLKTLLDALPYVIEYPFECAEQSASRLFAARVARYVAVAAPRLAASAKTAPGGLPVDSLRRVATEETPWLASPVASAKDAEAVSLNLLRPGVAAKIETRALQRLAALQDDDGGFPWFSGGKTSVYMSALVLSSLAATVTVGEEAHLKADPELAKIASRTARYIDGQRKMKLAPDELAFVAYALVASDSLDAKARGAALDAAFGVWKKMSRRPQLLLAQALAKAARKTDASAVFRAALDALQEDAATGTASFPVGAQPWLWAEDPVELHASALLAIQALAPLDPRAEGLARWLLVNRKLAHWKSTRATAEATFALLRHYGKRATLDLPVVTITIGGRSTSSKRELVFTGNNVKNKALRTVSFAASGNGPAFGTATWIYRTAKPTRAGTGALFKIERRFLHKREGFLGRAAAFATLDDGDTVPLGDEVEVELTITAREAAEFVHVRDPRPAGFEPASTTTGYNWSQGLGRYEEVRDSGLNFFIDALPKGTHVLKHMLRAATSGEFQAGAATLQPLYAPEYAAFSEGLALEIER